MLTHTPPFPERELLQALEKACSCIQVSEVNILEVLEDHKAWKNLNYNRFLGGIYNK